MSPSRVTYDIEKRGRVCKLTVVHELEHAPKTAKHVGRREEAEFQVSRFRLPSDQACSRVTRLTMRVMEAGQGGD